MVGYVKLQRCQGSNAVKLGTATNTNMANVEKTRAGTEGQCRGGEGVWRKG